MAASLSFTTAGAGPGLLLLHAFPLDGRLWRHQIEHFSRSHRVIVPDLPGFGRSRSAGPARSIDHMADEVATLLTGEHGRGVAVAGVSMGGYVALALLRRHPGLVGRLVLSDTRAEADSVEAKAGRARQLAALHGQGVGALFDQLLPRLVGPEAGDTVREQLRQVALDQTVAAVSGAIVALRDRPDATDTLRASAVPVLVVVGSDDTLTPPTEARAMADAAPRAEYREIAGAGHLPCVEAPEAWNRAVEEWLAGD